MAGTANLKFTFGIEDLGNIPITPYTCTITGVDEISHRYSTIASGGTETLGLDYGEIAYNAIQGLFLRLISGGATAAAGLSIDMSCTAWAATDCTLYDGGLEFIFYVPSYDSASYSTYVKNLSSDTAAVIEYVYFGEA